MTQRNVRGCYMGFEHDRAADWDWLSKWQPNVIRYMAGGNWNDPNSFDVNRVRRIHDTCPDATILLRCWELDDNNFKAHDAMVQDPRGTAEHQVDWWAKVFDRANHAGVPRDRVMAGLNNETGPEKDAALYPYTEHALAMGIQRNVRLGVYVFSAGRPSLPGEGQYTIETFSKLDAAILTNRGAIVLHEYMQPEGMYAVWIDEQGNERKDYTYLIGRHTRWNIKSPIIIGEWGEPTASPGDPNAGKSAAALPLVRCAQAPERNAEPRACVGGLQEHLPRLHAQGHADAGRRCVRPRHRAQVRAHRSGLLRRSPQGRRRGAAPDG